MVARRGGRAANRKADRTTPRRVALRARCRARARQLGPCACRPAGVFLLDSKLLHGTAAAGADQLRAGRLVFGGGRFRSGARAVKQELEKRLGSRAPWV